MTKYTIEIMQLVPNYALVDIEADSLDEAIALAKEYDGYEWKLDWEYALDTEVMHAWEGDEAYKGRDLLASNK